MTTLSQAIAQTLRAKRKAAGLSQQQLGEAMGSSGQPAANLVGRMERGEALSRASLDRWGKAMGIDGEGLAVRFGGAR